MPIDYTKRPAQPPAAPAAPPVAPSAPSASPTAPAVSLSKVTLTKSAPSVSLTKHPSGGLLRVNLNWNARPTAAQTGGGFLKRLAPPSTIDLDLGCLYEFTDGSKGVVQALGNSFTASPRGVSAPVIRLDGDDRSGANSGGENLFIDLAYTDQIRRIMVFGLIYEGVPNWAAADAVATLFPATGPEIEVRLDEAQNGARICGIALLESAGGQLSVRREVNYISGSQSALDKAYDWGMNWTQARK
jgi:tellurite resistance protein TerA